MRRTAAAMDITPEKGSALAEVRARTALRGAGLDPTVSLVRVSSVTNEVWLTPTHAVRVNRTPTDRLAREARISELLPPEVGYPRVVGRGTGRGMDWLISERVPGIPLAHCWPDLSRDQRRAAIAQLASRIASLHRTVAPADLPPVENAPQLLEVGSADPTAPVLEALRQAMRLDHVDPMLLHDARQLVERLADSLQPFRATTLVHGDLTFENVLWHDGEVTALLDVEWSRPGPSDLDLDIILRCCAYPQLHVAAAHEARTRAEDYAQAPFWLTDDYPELIDHPRQMDRLRVYSIAYDAKALLAYPPKGAPRSLPKQHPYNRLAQVVQGHSHLDVLERYKF